MPITPSSDANPAVIASTHWAHSTRQTQHTGHDFVSRIVSIGQSALDFSPAQSGTWQSLRQGYQRLNAQISQHHDIELQEVVTECHCSQVSPDAPHQSDHAQITTLTSNRLASVLKITGCVLGSMVLIAGTFQLTEAAFKYALDHHFKPPE